MRLPVRAGLREQRLEVVARGIAPHPKHFRQAVERMAGKQQLGDLGFALRQSEQLTLERRKRTRRRIRIQYLDDRGGVARCKEAAAPDER